MDVNKDKKKWDFKYDIIPIDDIEISDFNVRQTDLSKDINLLAESIDDIGLLQPILVYREGKKYKLIIGQRRYRAFKELGIKEIPALITTVDDEREAVIKSLSENIHRLPLNYRDKMRLSGALLSKLGTPERVAEYLGVTEQTVRNYLGYVGVPEPIKERVDEGKLSATTARRIVKRIADEKKAVEVAEKIEELKRSEDRLTVIEVAEENPEKTIEEVVDLARARKRERYTINVTQRIAEGVKRAREKYRSSAEEIIVEALEEWLINKGFIE
ncbi:hypothetical protein CEE36_10690 [candidate division TA06 bacterium B3_TA06]|uniref:ParB-like N-terminal domain-containing protein n=1 Tax=candidate division TA06 bacterium B3_TA06 TaxID=2012487 RepID=A0A532UU44_UNCT6|nr:MAG: hypothetical protein CEE36_10690 [candidate division TA06 bacterium B3_TA06]